MTDAGVFSKEEKPTVDLQQTALWRSNTDLQRKMSQLSHTQKKISMNLNI